MAVQIEKNMIILPDHNQLFNRHSLAGSSWMVTVGILVLILLAGCWEKQDHEITAPEIAYYHLEGKVKDIDLEEVLDSISVVISAVQLLEAPAFKPKTTVTEENGSFAFDSIYVGAYDLIFYRRGYPVLTKAFFQDYGDTSLTINLPDVYYISAAQMPEAYTEFKKLAPTKFTFHTTNLYALMLNPAAIHFFKWETNLRQWVRYNAYDIPLDIYYSEDLNITFGSDATYFYLGQKPDLLHKILIFGNSLRIEQSIQLPHYVRDVYYLNDSLYISAGDQLYVYDEKTLILQRSVTISNQDISIDCYYRDKIYFWAADNVSKRLYQCNNNLYVLKTYVPFTKDGKFTIAEMGVDYANKVWYR